MHNTGFMSTGSPPTLTYLQGAPLPSPSPYLLTDLLAAQMSCASTNATARPSEPSLSSHADTTLPTAETVKLAVLRAKLRAVIDAKVRAYLPF